MKAKQSVLCSSLRWLMIMALLLATMIFGLGYRRQILQIRFSKGTKQLGTIWLS
jgi:hypothetical protein